MTPAKDDMPDNYTGNHGQTRVRFIALDIYNTAHLWIPTDPTAMARRDTGTYCTGGNPTDIYKLDNVRIRTKRGTITAPSNGAPLGMLIQLAEPLKSSSGTDLPICSNCLTMAAVQAEMRGQNKYPIKRLLDELDGIATPPRRA